MGTSTCAGRGVPDHIVACSDRRARPSPANRRETGVGRVFMALGPERVGTTRMCVVMACEGSGVSKLPTQEKPNLFN
jgi:hypothetical protein